MPKKFLLNPLSGQFDEISEVALTPVGSSPNANGASIDDDQNLTLELADSTNPGLITGDQFNSLSNGSHDTFAGYDDTGVLTTIPGWSFDVTTQGLIQNLNTDPVPGNTTLNNFYSSVNPTANNSNSYLDANFITQYDTGNTGFSSDRLDGISIDQEHLGDGTINNMRTLLTNQTVGNGTGVSTVAQLNNADFASSIQTGATVTDGRGVSIVLNNNGTFTQDYALLDLNTNGNAIGRDLDGPRVTLNTPVGRNERLLSLSSYGTVAGDYNGIQLYNDTAASVTGNLTQINTTNNATVGSNFEGVNVGNNGNITGDLNGISFFNSGTADHITMMNLGNNSGGNSTSYRGLNIYNNANTTQNFTGINIDTNSSSTIGNGLNGVNVNLQGALSAGNATGIQVDMSGLTVPTSETKVGLNINEGGIQQNYTLDSALNNFQTVYGINNIGGEVHIASGSPITGGQFGFGNNIGVSLFAEDDINADASGVDLGFSSVGFVGQMGVAAGKTVTRLNLMAAGASIPTGSGNMTSVAMYRALGLLPQGGTLNVTNMYGLEVAPTLSASSPTNTWGVWVGDMNAHNYFAKNVVIGGTTGKPTLSDQLDITGSALISGLTTVGNIIDNGLTANTVPYANASKQLTSSAVTSTELGYVSGVTSSIQTQLNNKPNKSPGDINETTFSAANNQSSAVDLTGLAFNNAVVRSFEAQVSVTVSATSNLYEMFTLRGIQRGSDWMLAVTSVGDNSLFSFTITTVGQVQYTSGNYSGFISGAVRFRAITLSL